MGKRDVSFNVNVPVTVSGEAQIARLEAKLSASREEVERLQSALQDADDSIRNLVDELDRVKDSSGIAVLESELKHFKETAQQSLMEFRSYLEAVNLNDIWGSNDAMFEDLFRKIKDGSLTAQQAIFKVKTDFDHLLKEAQASASGAFDMQIIRQFAVSMESLAKTMDEVLERIARIETEGVKTVGNAVSGGSGGMADITEIFNRVKESAEQMSEGAEKSISSVSNLVNAIKEYADIDGTKLISVSNAFRNMAELGTGSFTTKSVENLVYLARQVSALNETGNFNFRFDIAGLKDFKVSSTIHHLTDFLASINDGQVASLERLSKINLANFSQDNFKVSKASVDQMIALINALSNSNLQAADISTVMNTASAAADRAEKEYIEEAEAIHQVDAANIEAIQTANAAVSAAERRISAEELLIAMLNRRRQAAIDAANAEELYRNATQNTALVPRMAGALTDEQSRVQNLNHGYLEHVRAVHAAAVAENEKVAASRDVSGAIDAEIGEVRDATSAEEQHTKAIGTTGMALLEAAKAERQSAEEANKLREILLSIIKAQQNGADAAYRYAEALFQIITAMRQIGSTSGNIPLLTGGQNMQTSSSGMEQYRDVILETEQLAVQHTRTEEMLAKSIDATFTEVNESVAALHAYNDVLALNAATESTAAEAATTATGAKQAEKAATEESKNAKQQEADATRSQAEAEKEAASARKGAEKSAKQYTSTLKQINNEIVRCENAQRKYAAAAKLGVGKEDYGKLEEASVKLRNLRDEILRTKSVTPEVAAEFRKMSADVSTAIANLKTNGSLIGRWATTGMEQLKSRLTYSFGLAAMVYKAVGEIKQMISTAVELDTAMNQLQIVTRSSSADMDVYAKRVSAMAKETAQATKDLVDASTVYARLGYTMDESATLAKYTAMLQGVGDIEAGAAQDAMTAILKAFSKNVDDVEDVMNKLVVVGNNFPVSVSDLAEGMNNAGSMLAVAGNSLEESIALLTAANTTVNMCGAA